MEIQETFINASEQLASIADAQEFAFAAQSERPALERKQAERLKLFVESGFRPFGEFDSFSAVQRWANSNPEIAVAQYRTRLAFDAAKEKFVVLKRPDGQQFGCGPSSGQNSALAADASFRKTLTASYGTDFGESQELFNELHNNLELITSKGPEQEGMSPVEKAAENSQAINNAAAANKNVQQLIGEKAAMTGAVPGVESGVTAAVRADAATKIENNLANEEAKITTRSYDIGRENYNNAVKEEMGLPAATMNPVSEAASPVVNAEKTEGEQADQNAAASNSWMGMVGGLADAAVSGLTGGIGSSLFKKAAPQKTSSDTIGGTNGNPYFPDGTE